MQECVMNNRKRSLTCHASCLSSLCHAVRYNDRWRIWWEFQSGHLVLQPSSLGRDIIIHTIELFVLEFGLRRTTSDVNALNLDYKRTNNIYIYLAAMRIMVVGLTFHSICVLNSNSLKARWTYNRHTSLIFNNCRHYGHPQHPQHPQHLLYPE